MTPDKNQRSAGVMALNHGKCLFPVEVLVFGARYMTQLSREGGQGLVGRRLALTLAFEP